MRDLTDDERRLLQKLYLEKLRGEQLRKDPAWRRMIRKRMLRLIQGGKKGGQSYD